MFSDAFEMPLSFLDFEPNVPIKSLKYKCLSQLASMMRQSESEYKTRLSTYNYHLIYSKESINASSSTVQVSPTLNSQPSDALVSSIMDPISSPTQPQSQSALNLPIRVVQQILDHIVQRRIPIRHQALCALLENGGCFSYNSHEMRVNSRFNFQETKKIVDILTSNCDHLCRLGFYQFCWIHVPSFTSMQLKHLKVTITSLDDLISIFSSFPNLIELNLCYVINYSPFPTAQQINTFIEELKKPKYDQVRHSLHELKYNGFCYGLSTVFPSNQLRVGFKIKLISCFPNLIRLWCPLNDGTLNLIVRALMTGFIEDTEGVNVTSTDVQNIESILLQLQTYTTIDVPYMPIISDRMPNLQEVGIYEQSFENDCIVNLKYVKSLFVTCSPEILATILTQIGYNLEYLNISHNDLPNMSAISRYCPNLKHLVMVDMAEPLGLKFESREVKEPPFRHLKTLTIGYRGDNDDVLHYILRHALDIEIIEIVECHITNDEKLTQLIEINPMKNLRVLYIETYRHSSVSALHFDKLINSFDRLCYAKYMTTMPE